MLTTSMNCATAKQIMMKRVLDIAGGLVGCGITLILILIIGPMTVSYTHLDVYKRQHRSLSKPDRVKAVIEQKVGKITKKEIMELCPDISKVTVERTLTELVKSGYIAKVGAGPSTGYVQIESFQTADQGV